MEHLLEIMALGLVHCLRKTDVGTDSRTEKVKDPERYIQKLYVSGNGQCHGIGTGGMESNLELYAGQFSLDKTLLVLF